MSKPIPMSRKIITVYLIGSVVLLAFYAAIFYNSILFTENKNSERRLALIAPYHLKMFSQGVKGKVTIDPMLIIYDQYESLPALIKQRLPPHWQGSVSLHYEDDSEYNIFSQPILIDGMQTMVYAVENIDIIEWDDFHLAVYQAGILGIAFLIFIVAAVFIVKMAKKISTPFSNLAAQLEANDKGKYSPLTVSGELSLELVQVLTSVNSYRQRIHQAFLREQAFTRYVSHELRTPMTVIRGGISNLRRLQNEKVQKQSSRIDHAVLEMEQLVHTFLLLARNKNSKRTSVNVSCQYVQQIVDDFEPTIRANQVSFQQQIKGNFQLNVEPLLLSAVIKNLLKNALNCSVEGEVSLFVSEQKIEVIDNGVGLDAKPRGYEGFGIGLNIVRDICEKYQWQFTINNNKGSGCTATVTLAQEFES